MAGCRAPTPSFSWVGTLSDGRQCLTKSVKNEKKTNGFKKFQKKTNGFKTMVFLAKKEAPQGPSLVAVGACRGT